jgi:hypothetical protein
MTPTDFAALQINLRVIHSSLQSSAIREAPTLSTTASYSTPYLLDEANWESRILKVWDRVRSIWFQSQVKPIPVHGAITLTLTTLFDQAVKQVFLARQKRIWTQIRQIDQISGQAFSAKVKLEQRDRYEKFLSSELEGSFDTDNHLFTVMEAFDSERKAMLTESEVSNLRHAALNFHHAAGFFWSIIINGNEEGASLRMKLDGMIEPSSMLLDRSLYKALKRERRWVELEGIMGRSVPISLIAKIALEGRFTYNEKELLLSWVRALKEYRASISFKLLSSALVEAMNVIYLQGSSSLTLIEFLDWLDKQGCPIVSWEDAAHMGWRDSLKQGHTIECNGKKVVLGRQISPVKLAGDVNKVFEIEGHPHYVVKLAHNRFCLQIEEMRKKSDREHSGVRFVERVKEFPGNCAGLHVDGLDRLGRCVVLEKLGSSLENDVWASEEKELEEEDRKRALVLANHIYCMSHWMSTPSVLSLSHLMWDSRGVLKSICILRKEPFHYNILESHCVMIAKDNRFILHFLMHVSQLIQHPVASYYQEAVVYTLKTGEINLHQNPLPKSHRLNDYKTKGEALCAEALELRRTCFNEAEAQFRASIGYAQDQVDVLKKEVANRLVRFYLASPTPGRICSSIKEDAIDSYSHKDESQADSFDEKTYYGQQHHLMMENNKAKTKTQVIRE